MKKTKSLEAPQTADESPPVTASLTGEQITTISSATEQQAGGARPIVAQRVIVLSAQSKEESQNIGQSSGTSPAAITQRREPRKPSANFTILERTFILMAMAAVRSDPRWRRSQNPADPEALKDFSEPFCNAVRQKLMEDPDFKGRVAIVSVSPEDGKYKQSPSKESIRKIWKNLYCDGSLTRPQNNLGRRKDFAAEERVKQYLQSNPDCKMSSRAIAAQTQTSHRNVIRIIRQENLAIRKTKFKRVDEQVKKRIRKSSNKSDEKDD